MKLFLFVLFILGQYVPVPFTKTAVPIATPGTGCVSSASLDNAGCTLSVTDGQLVIVTSKTELSGASAGIPSIGSTGPSCTWTQAGSTETQTSGGSYYSTANYTCVAPSSGSLGVTVTWSGGDVDSDFTDISTLPVTTSTSWNSPVLDQAAQNVSGSSGSTCSTGTTSTTTNANDFLYAVSQNFNEAETWGSYSGWTNSTSASRNTTGVYTNNTVTSSIGTYSASIPLSSNDYCVGTILALGMTP